MAPLQTCLAASTAVPAPYSPTTTRMEHQPRLGGAPQITIPGIIRSMELSASAKCRKCSRRSSDVACRCPLNRPPSWLSSGSPIDPPADQPHSAASATTTFPSGKTNVSADRALRSAESLPRHLNTMRIHQTGIATFSAENESIYLREDRRQRLERTSNRKHGHCAAH
jgi:hypothetical protein